MSMWAAGSRVLVLDPTAVRDAAVDLPALTEDEQRAALGPDARLSWFAWYPPLLPGAPALVTTWAPGEPLHDDVGALACVAHLTPSPFASDQESPHA